MNSPLTQPRRLLLAHIAGLSLGCSLLMAVAPGALAAYPDKPISLIVPFAPGGSSDNVGRSIAPGLGDKLRQAIVVENVGGAGGVLGTQRAVRAPADGYTLLVGSGSEILINKVINPNLAYDGLRDLAPLIFIATGPMVLVGRPDLPAASMKELLALARAKPGALSYASAGNGTPMHVAGELLKMRVGIFMTHIPYRGAAPALLDVMSGQVDLCVSTLSAAAPHIRSGKVKAYGITSDKPSPLAPDLPAIGMTPGLEGFDLGVWFGLFMPARTPADVQQKVQEAAAQVLADPEVRRKLADQGLSATGTSADTLKKFMTAEVEKYQSVVKAAKIKPE
jgi:tripartite-type tricarboxylate transporter receptor subunit TctC